LHIENEVNLYDGYDPYNQLRPQINRLEFYSTTAFELGWLLVRPLKLAKTPEEEVALAKRFSQGQKALYFWWLLDVAATNGGFIQFYYDQQDRYIPAIHKGLDALGITEMTALIRKAHRAFKESKAEIETARNKSLLNKELYKRLKALTTLDEEYYKLNGQTMKAIEDYARQYPDEFCFNEQGESFGSNTTKQFTTYFDRGMVKEQYAIVNNRLHGIFKTNFKDGTPQFLEHYEHGKMSGPQQAMYDTGTVKEITTIDPVAGTKKLETFYPHGQQATLEHYDEHQQKNGVYKAWFEDGQLKETATFINNDERTGEWAKYWPSGFKKIDAICQDGKVKFLNYWTTDGTQLMTDGNGLFVNEFEMDMAITKTHYRYETDYKNYMRNGLTKQYVNGSLSMTQEFKDDVEHGLSKTYDEAGNVIEEVQYNDGKLVE